MHSKPQGVDEAVLNVILKDLPVGVALFDLTGALIKCNVALQQMLGYANEEAMPAMTLDEFIRTESDKTKTGLPAELTALDGLVLEKHYTRTNGESLWGRLTLSLIPDEDDKPLYIRAILENITDYKQAVDSLMQEQYLTHLLMDNIPDHIYFKDLKGHFIRVNRALANAFGLDALEDAIGKTDYDFFWEEHARDAYEDERQIIQTGQGVIDKIEKETWKNRPSTWAQSTKMPLRDATGNITGTFGISKDITDHVADEEVLRQQNEELARLHKESELFSSVLMDNSPDVIYFKDLQSRFIRINRAHAKIFGLQDPCEAIGKTDFDFFTEEHAQGAYEDEQEIIHTGVPIINKVEKETWANRSSTWASTSKLPIRNAAGEIIGTFGTSRDVTAQYLAEEALREKTEELNRSNQELEQFAYVASHDLQEPLRQVGAFTQMLFADHPEAFGPDAAVEIEYVLEGVSRMQKMIQDLLAYSRVGMRNKPLVPTDAERVINLALANLRLTIQDQEAIVTHDPLPVVMSDETQLTQLFQNFINNAIKFKSRETPRVHVGVKPTEDGEGWLFSISDNGIGIKSEFFERIFVIFQRLHTRKEYSGTGIGLAVCKRIVERHGGHITVESEEGKGTTFSFNLPAETHHVD